MIALAVICYSICSSTLLLGNNLSLNYMDSPAAITLVQFLFTSVAVAAMKYTILPEVDGFTLEKVKGYSIATLFFAVTILSNIQLLSLSNVETVIVFRSCSPVVVLAIEYFYLKGPPPTLRSIVALMFVILGALVYCLSDSELALNSFSTVSWITVYLCSTTMDALYGKYLTETLPMQSLWGPVLYCNTLAIVPMFCFGFFDADFIESMSTVPALRGWGLLVILFVCITGTVIGYTIWWCRSLLSATSFCLVSLVTKFITVLLDVMFWDKDSTPLGLLAIAVCLISAFLYQTQCRLCGGDEEVWVRSLSFIYGTDAECRPLSFPKSVVDGDAGDKEKEDDEEATLLSPHRIVIQPNSITALYAGVVTATPLKTVAAV